MGLMRNLLAREAIFPFYASFKLTSRCHFGCPFCNVKKNLVPDMTTGDVKAILDNIARSPVLMTSFEGGEPLLREDIAELLAYARQLRSFYLLFTTSVKNLFDYPIADYARTIDFLHVSIDEGHGNMELFDRLGDIVALETEVSVQTVVTAQTVHALEEKVRQCPKREQSIGLYRNPQDKTDDFFPDMNGLERTL